MEGCLGDEGFVIFGFFQIYGDLFLYCGVFGFFFMLNGYKDNVIYFLIFIEILFFNFDI